VRGSARARAGTYSSAPLSRPKGCTEGVRRDPHDVQTIRFAAIDPLFEVRAVELCRQAPADDSDAPLLCLVEADRRRLVGRILRRSEISGAVGAPEPVGVCSLIASRGRLLIGRRRGEPLGRTGAWELVASDALDDAFLEADTGRVDYRGALLARLVECAPLARPARARLVPFALAHDLAARRWQLCLALELAPLAQACAEIERSQSEAYDAFRFVRPVDAIESGPDGADELAPLSAALVRLPRVDLSVA
jgi:hypothetical protein